MDIVKKLVLEAGEILTNFYEKGFSVDYKGSRDLVTTADITVENFFKENLKKSFPHIPLVGEETSNGERFETAFILDPLDGTTNFAHKYPAFCISMAYIEKGEIKEGWVYNPILKEFFYGKKGEGAYLNGEKISVSGTKNLKQSLLATGFPYLDEYMQSILNYFNHILPHCQGIRRGGSAALDLCYTACGRFDGFFELGLKPWDVSAGILFVREAGGRVTDIYGKDADPYDRHFVATNSLIHSNILNLIQKADKSLDIFKKYFYGSVLGKD
ncbi:MAG: inositol monophosphatase [Proteobacteria bacterium]|nr:inositol monophosphatase [Pseudomonadota bacterium]